MKPFIRRSILLLQSVAKIVVSLLWAGVRLLPKPLQAWCDVRGLLLVLIFVPPFFMHMWIPFPLAQSLLNPDRTRDAWTPILYKAGVEAQVTAQEMRESPQDVGNDFKVTRYTNKRVVNVDSVNVAAEVPTTGIQAADDALVRETQRFLARVPEESGEVLFMPDSRAFGKYLFVTLASQNSSEHVTIAVTKDGLFDLSTLFGAGYDGVVVESVANTLVARFSGLKRETAVTLTKKALDSKSFRLAVNGLVVSVPTRDLPKASTATAYHEVLVPMSIVEQYMRR